MSSSSFRVHFQQKYTTFALFPDLSIISWKIKIFLKTHLPHNFYFPSKSERIYMKLCSKHFTCIYLHTSYYGFWPAKTHNNKKLLKQLFHQTNPYIINKNTIKTQTLNTSKIHGSPSNVNMITPQNK